MKEDVGRSLSTMSTEVQETYDDVIDNVGQKIQEDLGNGKKKIETHFKVEPARLAVSKEVGLLPRSSDEQS